MRAVIFETFGGPLELRSVPDPAPAPDGVVLAVRANGICRSDWHGWQGHDPDVRLPHVPGHELAGEVVATGGEVRGWQTGDRVTVPFACGCGRCPTCRAGQPQICDRYFQPGFTAWGAFAEYVAIRHADANLVRLPEALGFVESASLGCRFATAFRAVAAQGRATAGEWVAVHGCGGVGLAAVAIAGALGARTVAVDVKGEALAIARALGATHTIDASQVPDVAAAVQDLTGGGAHVSLDALGSHATCAQSVACLRKQGRHVQVGLLLGDQRNPPVPMHLVIARELELRGSHGLAAHGYERLFDLIRLGRLDPGRLVGRTVSLEAAGAELAAMGRFAQVGVTVIDRF
jgi:alcohol dehydrogenase